MKIKTAIHTLLFLLISLSAYSITDSLSQDILQKTLLNHRSLDSIYFTYWFKSQTMDKNFNWTILKDEKGAVHLQSKDYKQSRFSSNQMDDGKTQYITLLKNIKLSITNQNSEIQLGCSPLPYYVIKLNLPKTKGSEKWQQTVYIDTLTYYIHASTMVAQNDDGSVALNTFTIESIQDFKSSNANTVFQINKGMLQAGDIAPSFSLKDLDGNTVNLSDFKGKLVLLDFWYSACKPCIKASYDLEELSKKYADRGVVVLGMNTMDKADKAQRHNKKHGITYKSVICTREIRNAYKIHSYPSFYLIDETGKIVFSTSGYSNMLKSDLRSAILMAMSKQ